MSLLRNLLLLIFLSALVCLISWIFDIDAFNHCYIPDRHAIMFDLIKETDLFTCLYISTAIVLGVLVLLPCAIMLISVAVYALFYQEKFPYRYYVLWISWLGCVYYVAFQLTFVNLV